MPSRLNKRVPSRYTNPLTLSETGSMTRPPRKTGDGTFVHAIVRAVRELRGPKAAEVRPVADSVRIDGKTCLVTGANSGLGKAAAVELARRGGNMILACRPGHAGTRDEIRRLSGSQNVEIMEVNLADLESVHRLCDRMARRRIRVDIALLNAGLMPNKARKTPQGYEMMFAVHFLSNRVMIDRWLQEGVIRPSGSTGETPRIVFVASEAHRSSHTVDFDHLGAFTPYGMNDSLKYYGISKLVLCTYATELSRRLNPGKEVEIAVHAMCPGGVATNISRDAPSLIKPILYPLLRHLFQSPEEAIGPAIYLCCAQEAGKSTGMYLHLMQRKPVYPAASDPANGAMLWDASEPLVARSRTPPGA